MLGNRLFVFFSSSLALGVGVEDEGEGNLTLRFGSTQPRLKETVVRKLRNRHEGGFGQGMVNSSWRKKNLWKTRLWVPLAFFGHWQPDNGRLEAGRLQ